jgi:hypothetical protein
MKFQVDLSIPSQVLEKDGKQLKSQTYTMQQGADTFKIEVYFEYDANDNPITAYTVVVDPRVTPLAAFIKRQVTSIPTYAAIQKVQYSRYPNHTLVFTDI